MAEENKKIKEKVIKLFIEQVKKGYISKNFVEKQKAFSLVECNNDKCFLKEEYRSIIKVAVTGGVFDILHPGHGMLLEEAKKLADVLVVVVARDETVKRMKRVPIVPEEQRVEMVSYLKPVDVAILGKSTKNFIETVKNIKPDYIVLGFNQRFKEEELERELRKHGLNSKVIRIRKKKDCPLDSTRKIISKIIEMCKKGTIW